MERPRIHELSRFRTRRLGCDGSTRDDQGWSGRHGGSVLARVASGTRTCKEEWNHESGLLRLLRNPKDIEDYFLEIPASIGSMVAFKVDQNCWHGYTPFEGKRLSIQLNYLYQGFLSKHNMRHKLSALFKKIPNILKK